MKKVYIVYEEDGGHYKLVEVFDSEDKAIAFIESKPAYEAYFYEGEEVK